MGVVMRPGKPVFLRPQYHIVAKESGKQYLGVRSLLLIKLNPARTNPGGAVKIPLLGDTMVKRHGKDREISLIVEIPYFFLPCVGFSRYPDA
jgi:hypothetical protein